MTQCYKRSQTQNTVIFRSHNQTCLVVCRQNDVGIQDMLRVFHRTLKAEGNDVTPGILADTLCPDSSSYDFIRTTRKNIRIRYLFVFSHPHYFVVCSVLYLHQIPAITDESNNWAESCTHNSLTHIFKSPISYIK